jgi:DNA polymerase III epsilon subunit-like protein
MSRFGEGLAGREILAWAAGVEIAFLRKIFGGRERTWRARTIDVRTLILAIERERGTLNLSESSRYSLESTATRFGVPVEQTHHALDDAFMTAELFLVAASVLEVRGRERISDLAGVRPD